MIQINDLQPTNHNLPDLPAIPCRSQRTRALPWNRESEFISALQRKHLAWRPCMLMRCCGYECPWQHRHLSLLECLVGSPRVFVCKGCTTLAHSRTLVKGNDGPRKPPGARPLAYQLYEPARHGREGGARLEPAVPTRERVSQLLPPAGDPALQAYEIVRSERLHPLAPRELSWLDTTRGEGNPRAASAPPLQGAFRQREPGAAFPSGLSAGSQGRPGTDGPIPGPALHLAELSASEGKGGGGVGGVSARSQRGFLTITNARPL